MGALCQSKARQTGDDTLLGITSCDAVQVGLKLQIRADAQIQIQCRLLEHDSQLRQGRNRRFCDVCATNYGLPLIRNVEPRKNLKQCGFPGAIRSQQCHKFACVNPHADVNECLSASERFAD